MKNQISFGIKTLDEATGGLCPGEFCLIAGGSGVGKTSLLLRIIQEAKRKNIDLLPFNVNNRRLDDAVQSEFVAHLGLCSKKFEEIRSILKSATWVNQVGLILFDGVEALESELLYGTRERLDAITRGMKNMARELDCCVIATFQTWRQCMMHDEPPGHESLFLAGLNSSHADMELVLHRSLKEPEKAVIEVLKNRRGPSGINVDLRFDVNNATFSEMETKG